VKDRYSGTTVDIPMLESFFGRALSLVRPTSAAASSSIHNERAVTQMEEGGLHDDRTSGGRKAPPYLKTCSGCNGKGQLSWLDQYQRKVYGESWERDNVAWSDVAKHRACRGSCCGMAGPRLVDARGH
jgi:hypothetical protein